MTPNPSWLNAAEKPQARPGSGRFGRVQRVLLQHVGWWLTIIAALTAFATYAVITRQAETSLAATRSWVWWLVALNATLLSALLLVVGQRAWELRRALKAQTVGSRLQKRVLLLFGIVALLPTLVVAVFSAFFFNASIQTWFDKQVSTALEESVVVAEAYLAEHKEGMRNLAIDMASSMNPAARLLLTNPGQLNGWLNQEAEQRSLIEAVIIYRNRIAALSALSFAAQMEQLPPDVQARAESGEVVVFVTDNERVRALVKLNSLPDAYLLIGRLIDPRVLQHMENAQGGVANYQRLQKTVHGLQLAFLVLFLLVTLLMLTAAMWYGMVFAGQLIHPIIRLIQAAERVRAGDYTLPVDEAERCELGTLARTFNRMMADLEKQRGQLIDANRQIDARRRFSETVLLGVSAGVIAVDLDGTIRAHNRSAMQILRLEETDTLVGQMLAEVVPAAQRLMETLAARGERSTQEETTHMAGERQLTLLVRITAERDQDHVSRYVVTLDDITELAVAQRTAAWADVARRVAHEIKNPLTPIHLATDRLRRKYAEQITTDKDTYMRYLDTITKHVADIGKMVEEFVAYARMPTPVFAVESLHSLIRKVVFSEQVVHGDILYEIDAATDEIPFLCDERQFSRAMTNLLKNAAEAMEGAPESHWGMVGQKRIRVITHREDQRIELVVADNGIGFPEDKINRLTEPYMTTREKGTGLGLAIVKKIVEEHGGKMLLRNAPEGGARVEMSFFANSDNNVTPIVAKM